MMARRGCFDFDNFKQKPLQRAKNAVFEGLNGLQPNKYGREKLLIW